jgi:hypothetical protein
VTHEWGDSRHAELPDDLQRWGWSLQQMKLGPRKHPGGWAQVIFWRQHGLAAGDDRIESDDPSLRVKVRRETLEDALDDAMKEMRTASVGLVPGERYTELFAQRRGSASNIIWTTSSESSPDPD